MVWRCVVYGCSNTAIEKEISVHKFPPASNKRLREAWTRFVQRTRANWHPTNTSYICSEHFVDDNYENKMQYDMSLACKLILKKDAVPTIYPKTLSWPLTSANARLSNRVTRKRKVPRIVRSVTDYRDDLPNVFDDPVTYMSIAGDDSADDLSDDMNDTEPKMRNTSTQYDRLHTTKNISLQTDIPDEKPVQRTRYTQTDSDAMLIESCLCDRCGNMLTSSAQGHTTSTLKKRNRVYQKEDNVADPVPADFHDEVTQLDKTC